MAMQIMFPLFLFFMFPSRNNAEGPPSPGYYLASRIGSIQFGQGFSNRWGPQHQKVDNGALTIWLDRTSGSGFNSLNPYKSGYFSAAMKLQPGYTAGVVTTFYLSNVEEHPEDHDEIDFEFLGTIPHKPYTLQTNVYIQGSGGREMRFQLWFDPTRDFHNYSILWNPVEIIFFVDDVPVRRYPKKSDATFPTRPMWVYGSIWDASSWATENGRYKVNYSYEPFVGLYKNFKIAACNVNAPASCHPPPGSPHGSSGLSRQQAAAMAWVQQNRMIYDYCRNSTKDRSQLPEC